MGKTVTKAALVEQVHKKVNLTKKDAVKVVEIFFDTIKKVLEEGQNVKISGFGNFVVRHKKARAGRNPRTGEEITIPERNVLTFKPSQVLKNALNSN